MSKFDSYVLLNEIEVKEYIRYKLAYFDSDESLICDEIGDGNINYVYRVKGETSKKTIIVKQAFTSLRISSEMFLPLDRGKIEADILIRQGILAEGYVPKVYLYDEVMAVIIMEDMINHQMMRTALINHQIFPKFAQQITDFLVNTLVLTSDIVANPTQKRNDVKKYINPDLCEITENLVYTDPYYPNEQNDVTMDLLEFVQREIYQDENLRFVAAIAKYNFLNNTQCLIHGDLHTGSIFINKDHLFVFDPEFACYGPAGYDIGNVVANMFFAWANGMCNIADRQLQNEFCDWTLKTIVEVVDLFIEKYLVLFPKVASNVSAKTRGYKEWFLNEVLKDTATVTALELTRRLIGMAKVKDILAIDDSNKRTKYSQILLILAKNLMVNNNEIVTGSHYLESLYRAIAYQGGCDE